MLRKLLTRPQLRTIGTRSFRSTVAKAASADGEQSMLSQFINADKPAKFVKIYHTTTFASLGLLPVALLFPESSLTMPIDVAMGVVFPVHGHIGFNYIISDYVPKPVRGTARTLLFGVTAITLLGLLKLNIAGDGMTKTTLAMWKDPKKEVKN
jgi:succinate dehydrogenase (ubiquinone) membrane anchor subunit